MKLKKRMTDKKRMQIMSNLWVVKSVCLTFVITFIIIVVTRVFTFDRQKEKLGRHAVELLYQFVEIQQLQMNMIDLQEITTEPVFNQLTIDSEDRSLYTYVQFHGNPTTVHVVKSTPSYVIYWIENSEIDEDRRFIFMFDCNSTGKISWVREAEINDFVTYSD